MVGRSMHTPHPILLHPPLAINYRNHQKSLAYFSHLASFLLFPKRQSQKGGEGHGPMTSLLNTLLNIGFRTLQAAELLTIKLFLNEFVAYQRLATLKDMRINGTIPMTDPVTGELNWFDERTETILTYALCGFSNFGSIGIMLGGLSKCLIIQFHFSQIVFSLF